jgi:hypothetical protein
MRLLLLASRALPPDHPKLLPEKLAYDDQKRLRINPEQRGRPSVLPFLGQRPAAPGIVGLLAASFGLPWGLKIWLMLHRENLKELRKLPPAVLAADRYKCCDNIKDVSSPH